MKSRTILLAIVALMAPAAGAAPLHLSTRSARTAIVRYLPHNPIAYCWRVSSRAVGCDVAFKWTDSKSCGSTTTTDCERAGLLTVGVVKRRNGCIRAFDLLGVGHRDFCPAR